MPKIIGASLPKQVFKKLHNSGVNSQIAQNVAISESTLLVPLAKSKKLAAIRKKLQSLQTIEKNPVESDEVPSSGRNKEVNGLLKEAQKQIIAKIDEIMASYPPAMKNKMFTLRYGSPESIKQRNMKAIFTLLNIVKTKKFALIESLDYFGNDTG